LLALVNTVMNHRILSVVKSLDQLLHAASYVSLNLEGIERNLPWPTSRVIPIFARNKTEKTQGPLGMSCVQSRFERNATLIQVKFVSVEITYFGKYIKINR
jgi:hypothetical protein